MRTWVRFFVFCLAVASAAGQNASEPLTGKVRLHWTFDSTLGPATVLGGIFNAAWGTAMDDPPEYQTHWKGFAKRYGMSVSGDAVSNTMEVGLGAIWGEDPRYVRATGKPLGARIGNVVKMTFLARGRDGGLQPAFARYAAISGSNFLSNTWRPDSEADKSHATLRVSLGFLGRMGGNAFEEFWPDVRRRLFGPDR